MVNFPPKQIANFVSEVLVLGAVTRQGEVVLLKPDESVYAGDKGCLVDIGVEKR